MKLLTLTDDRKDFCAKVYNLTKKNCKDLKYLNLIHRQCLELPTNLFLPALKKDTQEFLDAGFKKEELIVAIDNNGYNKYYSKQEIENLKIYEDAMKKMGIKFGVYDFHSIYSHNEVENASNQIRKFANKINKYNLSPLEKVMLCNAMVAQRKFNKNDFNESQSKSRSLYSILNNSNKLVCVGYAQLLKTILDEVDDKNIKTFLNSVSVFKNKNDEDKLLHMTNTIYLKDDKYGIDGYYYIDPTWNHSDKNKFCLTYFLSSINQIDHLRVIKDYYVGSTLIDENNKNKEKDNKPVKTTKKSKKKSNEILPEMEDVLYGDYALFHSYYSSVSGKHSTLLESFESISNKKELTLEDFLTTRKDFKEFLISKEIEKYKKHNKPVNIEEITAQINGNPARAKIYGNSNQVFEYFKNHSNPIDLNTLQTALYKIMPIFSNKNKDSASKLAKNVLNSSIKESKKAYKKTTNREMAISEPEL